MSVEGNQRGRKRGSYSKESCPRCGAPRCAQRHPIRRQMLDLSVMQLVESLHPSDGVVCRECGAAFRVVTLDVDDGYLISDAEMECVPNSCPVCGTEVEYE